jgi:iron-sulfur cluster repair protein YtfE (RIC family)
MIPQKRHTSLQPLSREHHHALLLCWKFRQGFNKGVEPERMKKYADWFWASYLAPHFKAEEEVFFPILAKDHPGIIKALKQHKDLKAMFHSKDIDIPYTLRQIAFELEQHIRFEERDLFNDIQEAATPEQLEELAKLHTEDKFEENIEDMFWLEETTEKKELKSEAKKKIENRDGKPVKTEAGRRERKTVRPENRRK